MRAAATPSNKRAIASGQYDGAAILGREEFVFLHRQTQLLKVGDIRQAEPNIHAGAKYTDQLMTRYFKDAKFDEQNRTLFAFASYNAGPGNISRMRKEAVKRGLDPDQWFNNVDIVTAEKIGIETTTYVRNIFKYYVAYKLATEARRAAAGAKGRVVPAK